MAQDQLGMSGRGDTIPFIVIRSRLARPFTGCRSPGCDEPAAEGSRFCEAHAARLAEIREAFRAERARDRQPSLRGKGARCCRPGCYETRVPPAAYCPSCSAAGYAESDDA